MSKTYVLDSSAIVAILTKESDYLQFEGHLDAASRILVGAPTLVESAMVLITRLGADRGIADLLAFLSRTGCETVAFTNLHFIEAARAFERFGKGRHPA